MQQPRDQLGAADAGVVEQRLVTATQLPQRDVAVILPLRVRISHGEAYDNRAWRRRLENVRSVHGAHTRCIRSIASTIVCVNRPSALASKSANLDDLIHAPSNAKRMTS